MACCESYESSWPYACTGANAGRVTYMYLNARNKDHLLGSIDALAPLTRLVVLDLWNSNRVSGDLSAVAGMAQLRDLNLAITDVSGDLAHVAGLTQLTLSLIHI